jgi:hypothetical protein
MRERREQPRHSPGTGQVPSRNPAETLRAKLAALYDAAGQPTADVTRRACKNLNKPVPPPSKLTNWRQGKNVPADDESMMAVVRCWQDRASQRNPGFRAESAAEWKRLRKEAEEFKAGKRGRASHEQETALAASPLRTSAAAGASPQTRPGAWGWSNTSVLPGVEDSDVGGVRGADVVAC